MRRGDIEGTLAKLNVARMLFLNQVPFRFVIPKGIKKKDYNFDLLFPNGYVACADAKCKIEQTIFSEGGIKNGLKAAREQLPNDKPGIIFIKTPQHWLSDESFRTRALLIVQRFLGGVKRIVSVKFYVEPISFADNVMRIDLGYREVSNPKTDFGKSRRLEFVQKHDLPPKANGMPPHYKRIILSRFRIRRPNGQE